METTNSVTKYIIKSYKQDGEFVGFLSAYSASGANQFSPQSIQAIQFDSIKDCIYADGQAWELDYGYGQKGYYKIETIGVINIGDLDEYIIKKKQKAVDELIEKYNSLTPEQKEQFKNQIK